MQQFLGTWLIQLFDNCERLACKSITTQDILSVEPFLRAILASRNAASFSFVSWAHSRTFDDSLVDDELCWWGRSGDSKTWRTTLQASATEIISHSPSVAMMRNSSSSDSTVTSISGSEIIYGRRLWSPIALVIAKIPITRFDPFQKAIRPPSFSILCLSCGLKTFWRGGEGKGEQVCQTKDRWIKKSRSSQSLILYLKIYSLPDGRAAYALQLRQWDLRRILSKALLSNHRNSQWQCSLCQLELRRQLTRNLALLFPSSRP